METGISQPNVDDGVKPDSKELDSNVLDNIKPDSTDEANLKPEPQPPQTENRFFGKKNRGLFFIKKVRGGREWDIFFIFFDVFYNRIKY